MATTPVLPTPVETSSPSPQVVGDDAGGTHFFEAKLRVHVKVTAPGDVWLQGIGCAWKESICCILLPESGLQVIVDGMHFVAVGAGGLVGRRQRLAVEEGGQLVVGRGKAGLPVELTVRSRACASISCSPEIRWSGSP